MPTRKRKRRWFNRLTQPPTNPISWLRYVISGSFYRVSDLKGDTSFQDICTQIQTMRALAKDSQISTALSYYATDATVVNTQGEVIWATPIDDKHEEVAKIINELFKRWEVTAYARDHILELATIGNMYMPTTMLYREEVSGSGAKVMLDNNSIKDPDFDIIPSTFVPPETILHLYQQGQPCGYMMYPDDQSNRAIIMPDSSIIHFSLGGLLGEYTIEGIDKDRTEQIYDIKFATPLMAGAVQPTQALSLLEDSLLLSSLARVIRFIGLECGELEEEESRDALQQLKDTIEQQLALNTSTGDAQSFINPQSPNNLIYVPKINGTMPIEITSLEMSDTNESDSKLLTHYQDKKLSVLGVPKEAMNFSSNEGLGGAGSVLSQRSALYANSLQRLETAYKSGWRSAINTYFKARGMTGFVDKYTLHMQPIVTTLSTITSERRDAALSQADLIVELLKKLGITDDNPYRKALTEILQEVLPVVGSDAMSWNVNIDTSGGETDDF